jgi:hypothetical protein
LAVSFAVGYRLSGGTSGHRVLIALFAGLGGHLGAYVGEVDAACLSNAVKTHASVIADARLKRHSLVAPLPRIESVGHLVATPAAGDGIIGRGVRCH